MDEEFITVEEAASLLGVSLATVRRQCAAGELPATKVGRSWVIEAAKLSVPARGRRTAAGSRAASAQVDLDRAVAQLRGKDLKHDVWAPDILNHEDSLAAVESLHRTIRARLDLEEQFEPCANILVPKSPIFQRNATDLVLADRIAYHAAVASVAERIDQRTHDSVFSARTGAGNELIEKGAQAWVRWNHHINTKLADSWWEGWLGVTDVTAYFDCILHSELLRDLQDIGMDPKLLAAIREMLRTWSSTPNIGIPQGPDASRLLANLYFHAIDDVMTTIPDIYYSRYMDDIRIVSQTRHAAINALQRLDDECRRRNLHLSTKKTKLYPGSDVDEVLGDPELDAVQYFLELPVTPEAKRKRLNKLFKQAVADAEEQINARHARFGITRLRSLRERGSVRTVLSRLEYLAPLGSQVTAYLLPWFRTKKVREGLTEFLENAERNASEYFSAWLLAGYLDEPRGITEGTLRYCREVCSSAVQPAYHQVVALNVLALGQEVRDIRLLRDVAETSYNPSLVRGACAGLARIGQLDRDIARRSLRIDGMQATIDYLRGRDRLPSLIVRGKSNIVE